MATYVYQCPVDGYVLEETRSIHEGPHPAPDCPKVNDHTGGVQMQVKIQSSLLIFGDFEIGDDDFSRRWHLNGEAGKNGGKMNRTQGQTNVNAHLRKWGRKGRPLESRTDIDRNSMLRNGIKELPGVQDTSAPAALRSSSAKGTSVADLH